VSPPPPPRDAAPTTPPPYSVLLEGLAWLDPLQLMLRVPELARAPRGRGEPVLVLPGFAASDASTLALRSYLRWLGYDARGWALGTNRGDLQALVPRVIALLEAQAAAAGVRVRCIGWSLGGNLAREYARERPDLVERVVTLGTPAVGGPKYTSVAGNYRRRGLDLDAVETLVADRERVPIGVPITAIYSRRDGIVAWQACIDRSSPHVEHVEVSAAHLGLGFHPEVYRVVADRLARP
jgi:pimeloyl-ACP methyl ester carboxylesterase